MGLGFESQPDHQNIKHLSELPVSVLCRKAPLIIIAEKEDGRCRTRTGLVPLPILSQSTPENLGVAQANVLPWTFLYINYRTWGRYNFPHCSRSSPKQFFQGCDVKDGAIDKINLVE
mgnify:CR=1 FL=1